jgi:hypothetical protein
MPAHPAEADRVIFSPRKKCAPSSTQNGMVLIISVPRAAVV